MADSQMLPIRAADDGEAEDQPTEDQSFGELEPEYTETEQESHFDREDFVSELTSYYDFLVRMVVPEAKVKRPPEGGWPSLTPDKLALFPKNDDIKYILQHIPYIEKGPLDYQIAIYPYCISVDYTGRGFARYLRNVAQDEEAIFDSIEMDPDMEFPPDVIWIGEWDCRDGDFMILNTSRGTITMMNLMGGPESTELSQVSRSLHGTFRIFAEAIFCPGWRR